MPSAQRFNIIFQRSGLSSDDWGLTGKSVAKTFQKRPLIFFQNISDKHCFKQKEKVHIYKSKRFSPYLYQNRRCYWYFRQNTRHLSFLRPDQKSNTANKYKAVACLEKSEFLKYLILRANPHKTGFPHIIVLYIIYALGNIRGNHTQIQPNIYIQQFFLRK